MTAAVRVELENVEDTRLRPNKLRNWTPKKWRVEYEQIVALSCAGMSNKMIASQLGYTPVHISNILQLDRAEEIRQKVLERLRTSTIQSIPDKLEYIANRTADRMKELVDDDAKFEKSPFAIIDRGMEIIKGLSHLKSPAQQGATNNIDKAIILQGAEADALITGLKKANEVRDLHKVQEVKVISEIKSDDSTSTT